jgi:hypothetical protein
MAPPEAEHYGAGPMRLPGYRVAGQQQQAPVSPEWPPAKAPAQVKAAATSSGNSAAAALKQACFPGYCLQT